MKPGLGIVPWCETKGIKFGTNLNAYTSVDQTVYNISNVPTENPKCSRLLSADPARLVALHRPPARGDRLGARRDHGGAPHPRRRFVAFRP